ncbi:PREDICTED: pleckstrin homology domain-containing family F member 1 [Cyprinodon variegatus]|uniref:pleckstrin homology domain-containing family F member 1 n=1 Tax=Cyprinodon variegatus TaxID=28743 RepID=UPI000742BEB0|nr:PREDICTED: pleckstrin homology domain-containing family F member 1 [Cyprinodon variegatus]
MMTYSQENHERIQAVEKLFGSSGRPLYQPGRVLIGEGRLMKGCRRGPQPKVFFLFNDVLVYGNILLARRWYNRQKIIPLEDIQLEDMEDSLTMKNQWLLQTPRKSFLVAAASAEEKEAWISHITDCQSTLPRWDPSRARPSFAVAWVPDEASCTCMRCSRQFSATQRRHHCRKCGFLVCGRCSKHRAVIGHIHPEKHLRICSVCSSSLLGLGNPVESCQRGGSDGRFSSDKDYDAGFSGEKEGMEYNKWISLWSKYYLKPEDFRAELRSKIKGQ